MKETKRIVIIGGGAAGFFAAITAAEASPAHKVVLLEKGNDFLTKVRISGGGRCNVTHACFEPRPLSTKYPRGARALIGAFHRFQPEDTVRWFKSRGVALKTEEDGRMFPVSDSSETIIDCLRGAAERAGVELKLRSGVQEIHRRPEGGFSVVVSNGSRIDCERIILATGGARSNPSAHLAQALGHTIEAPVPSLFTFHCEEPWLRQLPGVSVEKAEASVKGTALLEKGPLLITHSGLSGPVILRLSAWGARILHGLSYEFTLRLNWVPGWHQEQIRDALKAQRHTGPGRLVDNTPLFGLPSRLWAELVALSGVNQGTRWAILPKQPEQQLAARLQHTEISVTGKSLNKEEFVTCGGITLGEVDFRTMESRVCPGLFFAGELLDIDGITGGFNFQAAWTTGFIAGISL